MPKTMAAFGDSMTEALLAGYALEKGLPAVEYFKMLEIAAMDEELRLNAFRKQYGHRDLSWATGMKESDLVESHAERLKKYSPDLKAWNFAVSGARAYQLEDQLNEMEPVVETLPNGFDYVVMLIGNNDMLAGTVDEFIAPEDFRDHVETSLDRILYTSPKAKVLLAGPPEIFEIFDETNDIEAVRVFRKKIKCQQLRRTIYGDKVIFRPTITDEYEYAKQKLKDYREQLKFIADNLMWKYPEAEIRFIEIPRSKQRAKKVLSVDCFHPSEWGQTELAEATWKLGFWAEK